MTNPDEWMAKYDASLSLDQTYLYLNNPLNLILFGKGAHPLYPFLIHQHIRESNSNTRWETANYNNAEIMREYNLKF